MNDSETPAAIIVSDLHLGFDDECNKREFEQFINFLKEFEEVEYLILLGDMMDFWRADNQALVFNNADVLKMMIEQLPNFVKKYYIIGNHDYAVDALKRNDLDEIKNSGLSELEQMGSETNRFEFKHDLKLNIGGQHFIFIHGYQLEFKGPFWSWLYEKFCRWMCTSEESRGDFNTWFWESITEFTDLWKQPESKRPEKIRKESKGATWQLKTVQKLSEDEVSALGDYLQKSFTDRLEKREQPEYLIQQELIGQHVFQQVISDYALNELALMKKKEILRISPEVEKRIRIEAHLALKGKWTILGRIRRAIERLFRREKILEESLVYGHTHIPQIGDAVANVGCWYKRKNNYYLRIERGGEWSLNPWP